MMGGQSTGINPATAAASEVLHRAGPERTYSAATDSDPS